MRSEPTHLPTLLALCSDHIDHPKLRELAKHYSGTVHLTGVNAEVEKEAEALLLAERSA